ncbi:Cid1 family poly A polymerase, putative [Leishmania lindenbergi]|uniref:RNA uridylyltransferase n=1 Tax=Leishmania lindenbergi TaxID=651832 RepID=A0AAW3A8X3_9TRYP
MGYDMSIYIFGGLVTTGLFEVGGDVDFVGILDVEPGFAEAGEILRRCSAALRRLGLRSRAYSKARVPVIKADRVSRSLPGSPFHSLSCDGVFQFNRQVSGAEAESFRSRVESNYNATSVEWNSSYQFATVQFATTSSLVYGLANLKAHNEVEIPLRLPVNVRYGPEVYRFPFDFCLSSTGLRSSHLLGEALAQYPYSRHLLLVLKKWGRASGIINSIDGLLASYALTVMMVHFLSLVQAIPKVTAARLNEGPKALNPNPEYRPLEEARPHAMAEVGYLLATFLEYFGCAFDYQRSVVCTTNMGLMKATMEWDRENGAIGKPPFFHFAIKDPYGLDNIARNLDLESAVYVRKAHDLAAKTVMDELNDPTFLVSVLTKDPRKPPRVVRTLSDRGIHSESIPSDQLEARHALSKLQFQQRKRSMEDFGERAVRNKKNQSTAADVTKNVLGWIRNDGIL